MSQDRDRRKHRREVNRKFKAKDRGDWHEKATPKHRGAWNPQRWNSNDQNTPFDLEGDVNDAPKQQ